MIDWISTNYTAILTSLLGGSVTALLFFVVFRPRIIIVNKICKTKDDQGKVHYVFKFYNISLFAAVDVKPVLFWGSSTEKSDINVNTQYDQLDLSRIKSFYVPRWKLTTKKTVYAPHCVTIKCYDQNFEEMLKTYGSVIEFRVTLKHGFSNISRTKTRVFNRKQCIIEGDFSFGNTNKIEKKAL